VSLCAKQVWWRHNAGVGSSLLHAEKQQLVGCSSHARLSRSWGSPNSGGLEQIDVSSRFLTVFWALVADRALTGSHSSELASCLAGGSGRFGARVRSGLREAEQQESVKLGGSTVSAPSRVCWKVEQQWSVRRRHGQLSGLSGSLSSGSVRRETGLVP